MCQQVIKELFVFMAVANKNTFFGFNFFFLYFTFAIIAYCSGFRSTGFKLNDFINGSNRRSRDISYFGIERSWIAVFMWGKFAWCRGNNTWQAWKQAFTRKA